MDKIRKLIKETLENSKIFEGAGSFMSIPPNVGLIISKQTSDQIWLNLFNFSTKTCFGIITLRKVSEKAWGVTTIAAEKGFGPNLYELGMMAVYPAGICTDRNGPTNDLAFSVWKKFVDNRPDIKKVAIKKDDKEFSERYFQNEEKHYLENIICYRTPSIWYSKLIKRGNALIAQSGLSPLDISNACREYFSGKYNN